MGIGWGSTSNLINSEPGGAVGVVGDVTTAQDVGIGVGGSGVVDTYASGPPYPPGAAGFILLEAGVSEYLLQETGTPPIRFQLEQ